VIYSKHTGERPFRCHCGKAFSRLDNLRQHAQTVHSDEQDRNEMMMQQLTSLHSSLAASAAQAQVAHAQVLGKAGMASTPAAAFVPIQSVSSALSTGRRKSSMTAKPPKKKRSSVVSTPRRDSMISQSSAPARSADEAYFADQKEETPPSNTYHPYAESSVGMNPSGSATASAVNLNSPSSLLSTGSADIFQFARPPSSSGAFSSTFGHSTFGHGAIPVTVSHEAASYYAPYNQQALYSSVPPPSISTTAPVTSFAQMVPGGLNGYSTYPSSLSHTFDQPQTHEWRQSEIGPRGEMYNRGEGSAAPKSSNFQSTLSAHLAMRAPVLRPGRGVSPPSTAHSVRPSSSSSIGPIDRPVLPPLSSLSRPGTSNSSINNSINFNTGRRPSLLDANQILSINRGGGDDKRPYTSPAQPHLVGQHSYQAARPMLPSVRPTSAIRPGSRGLMFEPSSLFDNGRGRRPYELSNRSTSSAIRDSLNDRLRGSPPSHHHSPFRFQPPPLPNQSSSSLQPSYSTLRPISRDRPMTGNLPSLSTTLDTLKRARESRGRDEDYTFKRLRPFTSGDLPPPPSSFGEDRITLRPLKMEEGEDQRQEGHVAGGSRRVSIASLVEGNSEDTTSKGSAVKREDEDDQDNQK
jgi:hypothetical protein